MVYEFQWEKELKSYWTPDRVADVKRRRKEGQPWVAPEHSRAAKDMRRDQRGELVIRR